jgi:hypothetical protein
MSRDEKGWQFSNEQLTKQPMHDDDVASAGIGRQRHMEHQGPTKVLIQPYTRWEDRGTIKAQEATC